jgi:membrane-bound lytic murein transglycosylase D
MPLRTRTPVAVAAAALALSACAPAYRAPTPLPAPVAEAPPPPGDAGAPPPPPPQPVETDLLGNAAYDLPVEANRWVRAEVDFLVGERKEVIARWMERGDYYEPFVKSVLRDHGLPGDLLYLGMIESAFLPTVRSRAGAVGLWQFMAGTARGLGLRIDSTVDERMDPVRSTRAAARHLRSLRERMGDWPLATAAYNAGVGRISRGLAAVGTADYWELARRGDLAEETKRYVPRLYAMDIIAHRREHFGFAPPSSGAGFAFDSIQVEYATPLKVLAKLGDVSADELVRLNPHLLRGATPSGGYWVWVPAGRGEELQRAWLASDFRKRKAGPALAAREAAKEDDAREHVVRAGDTLWQIARKYGTTVDALQVENRLGERPIRPGMRLTIPS